MIDLSKCIKVDRGEFVEFWQDQQLLMCQFEDGWKMWFDEQGKLDRPDGPAVVKPDGTEFYYRQGNLHRVEGPAIVRPIGYSEHWIEGMKIDISDAEPRR